MDSLQRAGVHRLSVDLTSAEFVGKEWGALLDTLAQEARRRGLALHTRLHVVPPEAYSMGSFALKDLPKAYALSVHSVMCYGLRDTLTPVYRCRDFSHLLSTLRQETAQREVWYYPESAYWITFDNSVPVWLLSYLHSRWEDIELTKGLAQGHLTFSSGWDVGYWLFDWSIMRFLWEIKVNGRPLSTWPGCYLKALFGGDSLSWARLIRFQDSVLVGRNLLSYITPTTLIDELSWNRLPAFQPRLPHPPWRLWKHHQRYTPQYTEVLSGWREALSHWPSFPPCHTCQSSPQSIPSIRS